VRLNGARHRRGRLAGANDDGAAGRRRRQRWRHAARGARRFDGGREGGAQQAFGVEVGIEGRHGR
jgi:hypothetical protein